MIGELRLALEVEVQSGKQHASKHAAPGLWSLLARLGRDRWPALLRGDIGWASEANMQRAEQEGLPYLFKLRATRNVKRLLERALAVHDWVPAGQGWEGKEAALRLEGWSRARRVVLCCCADACRAIWLWRSATTASYACRSSRSRPRAGASSTKWPCW